MADSRSSAADRLATLAGQIVHDPPGVRCQSTRDHGSIRSWAALHQAEPATGEATASGPATVAVNDGAAGVRFNFPGVARFRPIGWEEWLAYFDQHQLLFVYEEQDPDQIARRAHELFDARGRQDGGDREDWLQAEQELRRERGGGSPSVRYHIVPQL
ncbi:MAG TPA: DUF2934 domain-containing protein [Vicinamibacterales bacterium]|nr:DUF2934 domain-containing protein [Vicinamibacterales bacterium]